MKKEKEEKIKEFIYLFLVPKVCNIKLDPEKHLTKDELQRNQEMVNWLIKNL